MVFHSSSDVSIPNSSSVVLYLTPPWVPFTHTSGISSRADVPAAVEFGRVAAAPVNTLRQQPHRCQEISVCF